MSWRDLAACDGANPNVFFPPQPQEWRTIGAEGDAARSVCRGCPVWMQCLAAGMTEPWGIWGGADPRQRLKLQRRYRETGLLHPPACPDCGAVPQLEDYVERRPCVCKVMRTA